MTLPEICGDTWPLHRRPRVIYPQAPSKSALKPGKGLPAVVFSPSDLTTDGSDLLRASQRGSSFASTTLSRRIPSQFCVRFSSSQFQPFGDHFTSNLSSKSRVRYGSFVAFKLLEPRLGDFLSSGGLFELLNHPLRMLMNPT